MDGGCLTGCEVGLQFLLEEKGTLFVKVDIVPEQRAIDSVLVWVEEVTQEVDMVSTDGLTEVSGQPVKSKHFGGHSGAHSGRPASSQCVHRQHGHEHKTGLWV
jgi:hypothetical protein